MRDRGVRLLHRAPGRVRRVLAAPSAVPRAPQRARPASCGSKRSERSASTMQSSPQTGVASSTAIRCSTTGTSCRAVRSPRILPASASPSSTARIGPCCAPRSSGSAGHNRSRSWPCRGAAATSRSTRSSRRLPRSGTRSWRAGPSRCGMRGPRSNRLREGGSRSCARVLPARRPSLRRRALRPLPSRPRTASGSSGRGRGRCRCPRSPASCCA